MAEHSKTPKACTMIQRSAALLALVTAATVQPALAQVTPAAGVGAAQPAAAVPAAAVPAVAPTTAQPAGQMRFYVELKDATLADALEMVFKAAGNPAHIIDDSARLVNIASTTFPNHDWHSIVRQLTATYNFRFSRNDAGVWVIEPRLPPAPPAGFEGGGRRRRGDTTGSGPGSFQGSNAGGSFGGQRGGSQPGGSQPGGSVPTNPFGGNRPAVRNFANPQTAPAFGSGTAAAGGAAADGEEKTFRILTVKHVYVGGLAGMFKGTGIIPTAPFVSPGFANGGMNGNNQGGGFGGGGFGGQQGGFGGGMGGFGGGMGGFGGGMGGFGGGMGGFGGGMGGFGNQGGFGGGFNTGRRRR